ncbi:MAG: hypothetical protein HYZ45_07800, partial [Burkholderiales bacterium]|nr:hypothetical protein [Burkholderiales bacterium]
EVTSIRSGLLYKKARFGTLAIADLSQLKDGKRMTLGMQRGTHALDKLEKLPNVELYRIGSVEQGLKMLKVDRLDATFLSSPGSDIMLRDRGLAAIDYNWL